MLPHGLDHAVGFGARKTQALHQGLGHLRPDAVVTVETNPVLVCMIAEGRRFADVVKEHRQDQVGRGVRGQQLEHGPGVDEHVALRMKLRGLLAALEVLDLRQDHAQQSAAVEQVESADPIRVGENLDQFLAYALGADRMNVARVGDQSVPGAGLDFVIEPRRETHGAQETELVFAEAGDWIANGANDSGREIAPAADEVDEAIGHRVVEHPVDGEIAAGRVLFGGGKRDHLRPAPVEVFVVRAERGHLEGAALFHDQNHAKVRADRLRVGKQRLHLGRFGRGGEVKIVRRAPEQFVPHATPGKIRRVSGGLQAAGNVRGGGFRVHGAEISRSGRSRQNVLSCGQNGQWPVQMTSESRRTTKAGSDLRGGSCTLACMATAPIMRTATTAAAGKTRAGTSNPARRPMAAATLSKPTTTHDHGGRP